MTLIPVEDTLLINAPEELREKLFHSGVMEVNEKFLPLYNLPPGTHTVILMGGRGGGKTFEASRFLASQSCILDKRAVVLRDVKSILEESILNEVLNRYDELNYYWGFSRKYAKMKNGVRNRQTGEMALFTKGFKASSNAKKANLKGISNIDLAVLEEMEDINSATDFNTFTDSIRKKGAIIVLILNTPSLNHFLVKRFFNTEMVEDGYFRLVPKKLEGVVVVQTTYLDNPYLPDTIITKYNAYADPMNPAYDYYYYMTAIMGYSSSGRKGQVFTKCKTIKLAEYLQLQAVEIFGQDFGTSSPAGLVGAKLMGNNIYVRQLNYLPKSVLEIGIMYCRLGFTEKDKIVADSAEPETIKRLQRGWKADELDPQMIELYPQLLKGFWVVPALKGPGSILASIGILKGMNIYIVEESSDFLHEKDNYVYDQDKNGNYLDMPIDEFNHLWDPTRYIALEYKGLPRKLNSSMFPGNR